MQDGNTCAHIAAMRGSVTVIVELMKFDKNGVISARNRITEATPLQLAAEGGHAQVVKVLVRAGASCSDENKVSASDDSRRPSVVVVTYSRQPRQQILSFTDSASASNEVVERKTGQIEIDDFVTCFSLKENTDIFAFFLLQ